MATATVTEGSLRIPALDVVVYIDGKRRSDVYCTAVNHANGSQGATAALVAPRHDWDGGKKQFRGRMVEVHAGLSGYPRRVLFVGWILEVQGGVGDRQLTMGASSLLHMAANVYLGQEWPERGFIVEYPERAFNPESGLVEETNWTIRQVLRDWLAAYNGDVVSWRGGGGQIPAFWRARIQIGSMALLDRAYNRFPLGDLEFRRASLADGLQQILKLVGTLGIREEFRAGGETLLQFYELADPDAPARDVIVAQAGEGIAGSNALDISHGEGGDNMRNRVIGIGDRRKYIVSMTTAQILEEGEDEDPEFVSLEASGPKIVKAWGEGLTVEELAALEAEVLADPDGTKKAKWDMMREQAEVEPPEGSEEGEFGLTQPKEEEPIPPPSQFTETQRLDVFRRFRLPAELRGVDIDKDNAVDLSDGSRLGIQVWKWPGSLTYDAELKAWIEAAPAEPELLEGTEFDFENLTFVLADPAVNIVDIREVDGEVVEEYAPAVVGVTITVNGDHLHHDTGVDSAAFDVEGLDDGLSNVYVNDNFGYTQTGNTDFPINGAVWPVAVINLRGSGWFSYAETFVLRDDREDFRELIEAALSECRRVDADYQVTVPWASASFRLGDRIRVIGQDDFDHGTHQIQAVGLDLSNNHQTMLSTSNNAPPMVQTILEDD